MQKGGVSVHGHTSTAGDGGQLTNLAVTGVITETGTPGATANDVPTLTWDAVWSLLAGN